jgi:hemerythrin-like domain-containing protein
MDTLSAFFTQDHAQCDHRFADAEDAVSRQDWSGADAAYPAFHQAMAHHFAMEESVLFPAFEAATGHAGGPTQVMRGEHAQMNDLLDGMNAALAERERDRFLGLAETLLWLMRQHNMKEENMLYPMCDQALGEQKRMLMERLEQT